MSLDRSSPRAFSPTLPRGAEPVRDLVLVAIAAAMFAVLFAVCAFECADAGNIEAATWTAGYAVVAAIGCVVALTRDRRDRL